MKRASGFTTFELLIVVAIIGIVTGLALFNYRRLAPTARLDRATAEVTQAFRAARVRAISVSTQVKVTVDAGAGAIISWADTNANGVAESYEISTNAITGMNQIRMVSEPTNGWFTSLGALDCDGDHWRVKVSHPEVGVRTVYVLKGGKVGWTGESL